MTKKPTKKTKKKLKLTPSRKMAKKTPAVATSTTESEAAVAVVRAWLEDDDFHEDPTGESPDRIEIRGPGYDGVSHEHYVDVRIYVPQIDIESEIEGESAETAA